MSNNNSSWLGNQQWSAGQQGYRGQGHPPAQGQQGQNWMQAPPTTGGGGAGEWQAMQQAPGTGQPQRPPSQIPFQQAQAGSQFPFQGQGQYPPGSGYGGGAQYMAGQGYPSPQQFVSAQQRQFLQQQERERKAKEEQKAREIEIQRRKMQKMNISKPSSGALEDLVGLGSKKTGSPASSRTHKQPLSAPPTSRVSVAESSNTGSSVESRSSAPHQPSAPPLAGTTAAAATAPKKTYSPSSRARAWTADMAHLEGVFTQHAQQTTPHPLPSAPPQEDDFGEFHVGVSGHAPQGGAYGGQLASVVSQRPVASTSISGRTKEGYMSTDVRQSRSHAPSTSTSRANTTPGGVGPPPPSSSGGSGFSGLDVAKLPAVYSEVYRCCVEVGGGGGGGEGLVSTERLFPVLLSSQLPTNVLRDLWSQANRGVPGKLSQTELFVLLGLIALVQSGHSNPSVEDLKRAPQPPVPRLSAIQPPQPPAETTPPSGPPPKQQSPPPPHSRDDFGDFQQGQTATAPPPTLNPTPMPPTTDKAPPTSAPPTDLASAFPVSDYKPPADDKYSVFSQLASGTMSGDSQSQGGPSSSTGGDLSAFGDFAAPVSQTLSETVSGSGTAAAAASGVADGGDKYGALRAFSEAVGTAASTSSGGLEVTGTQGLTTGSALLPSDGSGVGVTTAGALDDDFGAFSSGPMPPPQFPANFPTSTTQTGPASSQFPANFPASTTQPGPTSQFPANFPTSQSNPPPLQQQQKEEEEEGWADFASVTPGPVTGSVAPPTSVATAPVISASAFDDLLPKEFLKGKDAKPSNGSGLDVAVNSSDQAKNPLPDAVSKDHARPLTGLEILEEEMNNRLTQAAAEPKAPPPPPGLTGHSLVPEQVGASSSSTSLDNFGEFEGYSGGGAKGKGEELESQEGSSTSITVRTKTSADPCQVWSSCLDKGLEVLSSCAAVFASVEDPAILQEIAQSEEGRNRLKCIVEVYRLTRRIYYSLKERKCADSCKEAAEGIKEQWMSLVQTLPGKIMEELYKSTNPVASEEQAEEGDFLSDTISRCSLCLVGKSVSIPSALSLTLQPETYSLPLLFHEGQMYHAACANFWVNVVQEKLPDLNESL